MYFMHLMYVLFTIHHTSIHKCNILNLWSRKLTVWLCVWQCLYFLSGSVVLKYLSVNNTTLYIVSVLDSSFSGLICSDIILVFWCGLHWWIWDKLEEWCSVCVCVYCMCMCVEVFVCASPPIQNSSWWERRASCWQWRALLFSGPRPEWLFHS